MLIDSHCHLHDREFFSEAEAEEMLERAHEKNVQKIICIGTSHEDSLAAREFANTHDNVCWTYGIHPSEANMVAKSIFPESGLKNSGTSYAGQPREPSPSGTVLSVSSGIYVPEFLNHCMTPEKQISATYPVAIGEVGLDYHYEGYDREAQIRLFEEMLQLAVDNDLPVSFHVREAFVDFLAVVSNFPKVRGVVHSFTDSKKTLKRILNETDFYIGVNGIATYATLPTPPLQRTLLETDAPFLAPAGYRGKTNEPSHIYDIAVWVSQKFDLDLVTVAEVTTKNAKALFRL